METNNTDENISNKLTSSEKENINILKAILSTGNIGIWHMDIKANLIYLDDTMFEIFGIKKTDHFKYEDWKEYIHPEDLKAVEKALQKIIEDKNINTIEFRIIQPKGDIKYIQCPLSVVSDNYNQPLRITGACTDITQKKMLEEEIKYLSNLPEDNPNPMICVNPDFKIIYTNNASKPLIELIQTDDIMSINNEWRSIIDNLKDYSGYKTEVICGGRIYLVSITKNKKTGFINICGNDITERKEKELVIQQNNNALAESNKKLNELYKQLSEANEELVKSQNIIAKSERSFKLLIENMPLGVSTFKIIKDDQGTPIDFIYLSINKSYEKISMLKADEIRGKSFLKIISDIESQWIELFKKVALTGKNEVYERFNKIWNKHISVTIYTPENDIIVCFVEDISQKKLEEIKIINQKNELEKANEKLRNINEELIKTQKLKERSELSYKLLVENMPWGIATFKMNTDNEENPYDFIFISVNKAYEKISGLNENQMINNSLFKILPDFEPQLVTLFKNVVTTGVSDGYERFNKIWGRHLSVRAFTPEKDILVCFVEDITQKKLEEIKIINQKAELEEANKKLKLTIEQLVKAQERQTKSEQSLKRLVENMPLGIATLKVKTDEKGYPVDFIFHSINKETEKLFKLKASEIIGKSICEIFPDIEPKYFKIDANVAITGESAYYERFNKTINKYIFVKLYLSEKNILVSFFEDVTEKRLEESKIKNQKIELEQVNKQLKIANEEIENAYTKIKQINIENFKILFEMINIGTAQLEIISDQFDNPIDFKFLNANIAFEKITGLNINKIIGKTLMDIFPDSGHKWIELYGKSALLGKRIEYVNYNAKINSYFIAVIYYLGENNVAVLTDKIDKETYEKKLIDLKKNE